MWTSLIPVAWQIIDKVFLDDSDKEKAKVAATTYKNAEEILSKYVDPKNGVLEVVSSIADSVLTDSEKQALAKQQIELIKYSKEFENMNLQVQTNQIEASQTDPWSRRWRPYVGFCLGTILLYVLGIRVAIYDLASLFSGTVVSPPAVDIASIVALLSGMLGLGLMRTGEKLKKVAK